jgi:hypothetical protein
MGLRYGGDAVGAPPFQARLAALLRQARRGGARVVAMYGDAWLVPRDAFYAGLGDWLDVVHHMHPTMLSFGTPAQQDTVFCYPFPFATARPTLAPDSIAHFSFVGAISYIQLPRLVWRAELGRIGAPVQFFTAPVGDVDYVNVLSAHRGTLTFTKRVNGLPIFTGRSIEALMAGSVLIEEASGDTQYFLQPEVHYAGFETLAELTALLEALSGDADRRARLRAEGQAWVTRWFDGEVYWAGLLEKAFG